MATTSQTVQQLYIAYFGRPADPAGAENAAKLVNWAGNPSALLADFGKSAEYTSQFSGLTASQIVNKIYLNLFGRDAEANGLQFWSAKVSSGEIPLSSATWTILSGVTSGSGDDVAISSKVSFAEAFTAKLVANAAANVAYNSSTLNLVKTEMAKVKDAASLATANTGLDSFVTSVISGGANSGGSTFTLTAGVDMIDTTKALLNNGQATLSYSAGNGNDTVLAEAAGTFAAGDYIDGGLGTDTLNASYSVTAATAISVGRTANVENFFIRADLDTDANGTDTSTIDVTDWAGAKQIWADRTTSAGNNDTLQINNIDLSTELGVKGGAAANQAIIDFNFKASQITGSTDAATLNLNGAAAADVQVDGIESLTVKSATAASTLAKLTAVDAKTVTISGDKKITVSSSDLGATAVTINAADAAGGVDFAVEAADVAVTFTGGAGDDRLNMGATLTTADKVDGGTGTNTLAVSAALTAATSKNNVNVKNIQVVEFTADVDQDLALVGQSVTQFKQSGAGSYVTTNNTSSYTHTFTADQTTIAPVLVTDGLNDSLSIVLRDADVTGELANASGASAYEVVNVASYKSEATVPTLDGDANVVYSVDVAAGRKLNITGDATFKLTGVSGASITNVASHTAADTALVNSTVVDASKLTGTFSAFGSDSVDELTGSATKANTISGLVGNDIIVGGAGNDTITGGQGADTMTGGEGKDTFVFAPSDSALWAVAGGAAEVFALQSAAVTAATGTAKNFSVTVNGYTVTGTSGATVTDANLATAIAAVINGDQVLNQFVTATVSTADIILTSNVKGNKFSATINDGTSALAWDNAGGETSKTGVRETAFAAIDKIVELDLGGSGVDTQVDAIKINATAVAGATATTGVTIVNSGNAQAMSGASLTAAVDTLFGSGALDATDTAGLFTYDGKTYLVANFGNSGTAFDQGVDLIVEVTGVKGTLDATDFVFA